MDSNLILAFNILIQIIQLINQFNLFLSSILIFHIPKTIKLKTRQYWHNQQYSCPIILVQFNFIIIPQVIHMFRLLKQNILKFAASPPRRQNFFELNPIFPDLGQKDFDIYNVDYKHIKSGKLAISDQQRYNQVKKKLIKDIYLQPILERTYDNKRGNYEVDQQTGFPLGIHQDFDNFIEIFKRQKKVGNNIVGEFEDLVLVLMKKFEAKSQLQLMKIFRFSLANINKHSLKDKLRALLINNAFIRFIKERKGLGIENQSLTFQDLEPFFVEKTGKAKKQKQGDQITKQQLQELTFRNYLAELDGKISKIEEELHKKAIADGTFIPQYHPTYGEAIKQKVQGNKDYDINYNRGYGSQISTNMKGYTPSESQDRYIESRINRLFFLRALNQIQANQQIKTETIIKMHDLPINIRQKDKVINSLLYKYKEYDLMIEPNLEDIYKEIDIALKKVAIRVVPNFLENQKENQTGTKTNNNSHVNQRIIGKDVLLWQQLDVEQIFDPDYYEQQLVQRIKIKQTQISQLSPSSVLQFSMNKLPLNLYRHADLDNFGVFTKYRKRIYKDYITDRTIDPEIQFKFFSLEQAQNNLRKIKKPTESLDRIYGYGKRKSSQAQVYLTKGTGKVIINGQPLADYFGDVYHRGEALKPLIFTETAGQFDLQFTVVGGGLHSQSECLSIALTNALIVVDPKHKKILSNIGLVGIDDRKKQAKKIGFYTARVRPPYVRR